jgi:hypothetical protein
MCTHHEYSVCTDFIDFCYTHTHTKRRICWCLLYYYYLGSCPFVHFLRFIKYLTLYYYQLTVVSSASTLSMNSQLSANVFASFFKAFLLFGDLGYS